MAIDWGAGGSRVVRARACVVIAIASLCFQYSVSQASAHHESRPLNSVPLSPHSCHVSREWILVPVLLLLQ